MELTNKKINEFNEKIKSLEARIKTEQKKLHDEQRKRDQRRCYIIGEMVVKYFPELAKIIPGNKTENAERFSGFDSFLQAVSSDEKFSELFYESVRQKSENGGNA